MGTKEIIISREEKLDKLAEQIKAILVESIFSARMTLLEGKHKIGEEIVKSGEYKKGKTGRLLIKAIIKRIGGSESDLYLCVQFYERYPKLSTAVESLPGKKNDITWAGVRRLLSGGSAVHTHQLKEIRCWQCQTCGQLLRHKSS